MRLNYFDFLNVKLRTQSDRFYEFKDLK